jgi:hypothetical protein
MDSTILVDLTENATPEERVRRLKAVGIYANVLGVARTNGASWDDASAAARRAYEATVEVLERKAAQ